MKLVGIELVNFRSIGHNPVILTPLKKCNIIMGQNNAGKSNVLKGVKIISDKLQRGGEKIALDELDLHMRSTDNLFTFKLWFTTNKDRIEDTKLEEIAKTDLFWFEATWSKNQPLVVKDNIFAGIKNFQQANSLLNILTNRQWGSRVSEAIIRNEFIQNGNLILTRFTQDIPSVFFIPEFRQIRQGDTYGYDGQNLIKLLSEYQVPPIGRDNDQQKFEKIQEFVRKLLHLPNAILEFPRGGSTANLAIKNDGLRLPLSSYGTGVHELIIIITAVLSRDNAICCIEEPEIHLHPRLQRELIEFLTNETTNQYLITTHSATLINSLTTNENIAVFHIQREGDDTTGEPIINNKENLLAIRDLGLKPSDLMQANCILWVEGLTDRIYIQRWIEVIAPEINEGRDYTFMYYSSLPKLNFETDTFSNEFINVMKFNPNAIVVIDRDANKAGEPINKVKKAMIDQCESSGGVSWITSGREIENHLTTTVIKKACKDLRDVEIDVQIEPFDEFSEVIDKALKAAGAKAINYNQAKINYSRKFAEYITTDDIEPLLKEKIGLLVAKIKEWNS